MKGWMMDEVDSGRGAVQGCVICPAAGWPVSVMCVLSPHALWSSSCLSCISEWHMRH